MSGEPPVVFFDGYCGLCDKSVTYLFGRDHAHVLRFAPLQGKTAEARLDAARRAALDTIVLLEGGVAYERSAAVLRATRLTGGLVGALAGLALLVPRVVRDAVYKMVAANRYRMFGKSDSCRLPTPAERAFFLD